MQEVWAFWQRQRDHPKYRVLVGQLVAGHAERSAELLDPGRRRIAAARVRAQREQRDAERYALLDAAISRLVDRHGAVPRDKVDGLHEVGALAGLTRDEVSTRLRRHRMSGPSRVVYPAAVDPDRRRQLRTLLDDSAGSPRCPRRRRCRAPPSAVVEQFRPGRGLAVPCPRAATRSARAVVDDLLVHVTGGSNRAVPQSRHTDRVPRTSADHAAAGASAFWWRPAGAHDHQQLLDESVDRGLTGPRRGLRPRSPPIWARSC